MSQRHRRPTPRAAAYLRVSNEAEGNPELVRQREAIEAYAHQQGYLLVGEYLDACPGISQQRPGLTRMMSDARMGDFEVLLVIDTTRLFRDPCLANMYRHWLAKDWGVEVEYLISAAEGWVR